MANRVGGPPNPPPPNPDQPPQDNAGGRIGSIFRRIFPSCGQDTQLSPVEIELQPPAPLSSRENQLAGVSVSAGGIDLSDKEAVKKELKAWRRSLPFFGLFIGADKIEEYLLSINLAEPFKFEVNRDLMEEIPSLPNVLQNCTSLDCRDCDDLKSLPQLPNCKVLNCSGCTRLQALPSALPVCEWLNCSNCDWFEAIPEIPVCKTLYCCGCPHLERLPKLLSCIELDCSDCTRLRALPELPAIKKLNYNKTYAFDLRQLMENVRVIPEKKIDGITYFPKVLPEELKVELTPPLPDSASIENLETDLTRFIDGLKESDLPTLKKEIQGEPDLASYKKKLTEWKTLLFTRVRDKEAYLATPEEGTKELVGFYNQIEYYLKHLDAFLSKEENRDAHIERLRILQTQSACGARFIAELEQLFSLSCVGSKTADLSNQFAQIASSEAKLAINNIFPDGNVHDINQAMFQLNDYLTGTHNIDRYRSWKQANLLEDFFINYSAVNLVNTIQASLKPGSPMEQLFIDYLRENFSPELDKDQLSEVIQDLNDSWKSITQSKIEAFKKYDKLREIKAENRTGEQSHEITRLPLTEQEKSCVSEFELSLLLAPMEAGFKNANFEKSVQSKKDEILYQNHYDGEAKKWKPGIIAKALQKMGILTSDAEFSNL